VLFESGVFRKSDVGVLWQAPHLLYGLLRLRLPLETRLENPDFGLAFDVWSTIPRPASG
jgi:hypothetical protein